MQLGSTVAMSGFTLFERMLGSVLLVKKHPSCLAVLIDAEKDST